MLAFRRRRSAAATLAATTFCDACAEVSTPHQRAAARYEHARTAALAALGMLR